MNWFRKQAPDLTATAIISVSDENLAERKPHSTWHRAERVAMALQEPIELSQEYIVACTSFPAVCPTCASSLRDVHFNKGRHNGLPSFGLWSESVDYECGLDSWRGVDGVVGSSACPTTLPKCPQCLSPIRGGRNFCHEQCAAKWAEEHVT